MLHDKWKFFLKILMLSLNKFAPLHRVNCKNSRCPPHGFLTLFAQMIKEKYKARHLAQRTGDNNDWSAYRRLRNQLKGRKKWITFSVLFSRVNSVQRSLHSYMWSCVNNIVNLLELH